VLWCDCWEQKRANHREGYWECVCEREREREREREGQMMLISNIMKGQVGVDLLIECDVLADE
jgi:hypothetical protein